ncbi:MAG: 2-keto-4-pentenoate hydratase, partial [Acidimicrobiales bacterium]
MKGASTAAMLGRVTPEEQEQAAAVLRRAQATRTPVGPLSIDHPGMDVTDAYRIQLRNVEDRLGAGRRVRGHKVGLSSKAMQEMMGVDEPDYGHLLDDMFVFEDTAIDADLLIQPRVEVEV